MEPVAVVIAGGEAPPAALTHDLDETLTIVAADGGVGHARTLDLRPDVVVGDLDSATPADLVWARNHGATIEAHPEDKDETDLELALAVAGRVDPERIVVLGSAGGRLDHQLGNWAALAAPTSAIVEIRHVDATTWITRRRLDLEGPVGSIVSLLPWGGSATGVRTSGLRWNLDGAELSPFAARGVSNEFAAPEARIELSGGVLLVVQPRP